jgi:Protein of unknwon function (DUF3310)
MQNIKELPSKFKVKNIHRGDTKMLFKDILTLRFKVVEDDGMMWSLEESEALRLINEGTWVVIDNPDHKDYIKPDHYHQNGIDVIRFSKMQFSKEEVRGFMRINILKYATRYHRKNGVEDLKKMIEYAEQLIELEESK